MYNIIKVYYITAKHKLFIFIITDMLHDKQTLIIPEFVYKCNDKISQHPQDSFILRDCIKSTFLKQNYLLHNVLEH